MVVSRVRLAFLALALGACHGERGASSGSAAATPQNLGWRRRP
jgi:hypothetical protein